MKTIRFKISDEVNKKIMTMKGGKLKIPYAQELFREAVNAEYKKQNKK